MLSNPTTLHQRQRQHRRQNSTPTAFESPKVPSLPTIQRNVAHRRGMSLDQRLQRQSPPQDIRQVSDTNKGFQKQQQQILRETQQQRLARPGQQQQTHNFNLTNDENYLISPLISPQRQNFDTECHNLYEVPRGPPPRYNLDQVDTIIKVDLNNCSNNDPFEGNDTILFPENGNTTPSAYLDFSMVFDEQDWGATVKPRTRPSSRRVSGGIAERVAKFENMAAEQLDSRPVTPLTQHTGTYFPPTPDATPSHRNCHSLDAERGHQKIQDPYNISMEATIKPSQSKINQRARNIFQEMRDHAELDAPSPPRGTLPQASNNCDSARMPPSNFMNMTNLNMDFMNNEGYESSYYSPTTSNISPELSQQSSPEMSQMPLFGDPFRNKPDLEAPGNSHYVLASQNSLDRYQTTSPRHRSPHNRSLSVDSINLEETITETGITGEDIACYIDGPDLVDQKWLCLYPECKKRFGRKENIKSHIQTHLGDRQYQCPHCKKCFVRQHDLKRHAKIHSGVKPYPCLCGNSFARHDALTRHRQRGMCIGAFEGVVKKVVKRGRPRKARPDVEERLDKASKTRNKNKDMSSASSTSGLSDSSYAQTPPCDFDILDERPFGDFTGEFSQPSTALDSGSFQYSTGHSPLPMDYVSPQVIQSAPSPSALSTHSQHSHFSQDHTSQHNLIANIGEQQSHHKFSLPSSPTKSHKSYNPSSYNTPPELCLSSSSPPLSSKLYDPSSQSDSQDMDLSRLAQFELQNSSHEDDAFLNAFENRTMDLSRFEEDPGLLLMDSKFENTFGIVEHDEGEGEIFGDDVFFGSP